MWLRGEEPFGKHVAIFDGWIEAADNIDVHTETELVELSGSASGRLERICWRHNPTDHQVDKQISNLFIFIGVDPATAWLKNSGIDLNSKGFVLTGRIIHQGEETPTGSCRLKSNCQGICGWRCPFRIGQARRRSNRRGSGTWLSSMRSCLTQSHSARHATGCCYG